MRGILALRLVLPALLASLIATAVSWLALPDGPTYQVPAYSISTSIVLWALWAGPIAGLVSVGYVRLIAWADPTDQRDGGGWSRPYWRWDFSAWSRSNFHSCWAMERTSPN